MAITDIRLQNFRSHIEASFELSNSVNIVVGPNASGKTNLLEAILVLAGHNSYRAKFNELVNFNKSWARLDANTPVASRTVKIEPDTVGKTYVIDNKIYKRLDNAKKLPVCLFEPNHLLLLSGSPELRRSYIDNLCEQIYPEYGHNFRQYKRTLAQRNHLLKSANPGGQIFSWNIRLSELAGKIVADRLQLINELNKSISKNYQALSKSDDKINTNYLSKLDTANYESSLLKKLEEKLELEIMRGFTLYGPHRDDLTIAINNNNSGDTASRGEARTLVLALKILEAELLEKTRGEKPLLLLDDVFSELDGVRRQKLTNYLSDYQTFITTTDADVVLQHFTGTANIIPLAKR